jgi:hypothetical protein
MAATEDGSEVPSRPGLGGAGIAGGMGVVVVSIFLWKIKKIAEV